MIDKVLNMSMYAISAQRNVKCKGKFSFMKFESFIAYIF